LNLKKNALRMSHGDFNAKTKVTKAMKLQLKWWFDYIKAQSWQS
jgi:hypothetical protein